MKRLRIKLPLMSNIELQNAWYRAQVNARQAKSYANEVIALERIDLINAEIAHRALQICDCCNRLFDPKMDGICIDDTNICYDCWCDN